MKINNVAQKVVDDSHSLLIRPRKDTPGEYDYKEYQGKKKGWAILDATTAHVITKIYNALSPEKQSHYINLPLPKLINISWKLVK